MSITDKELLTICNLSNLQMEYANIIKGYKDGGKDSEGNQINIPINHTIYSLLKKELELMKNRKELFRSGIKTEDGKSYHILKFKEDIENKREKYIKENSAENIDLFLDPYNYEYLYNTEEELTNKIPLVIERVKKYDKDKKGTHKFIDEWEILECLDNYNYLKMIYEDSEKKRSIEKSKEILGELKKIPKKELLPFENNLYEKIKKFLESVLETEKDSFPTRKEMNEELNRKIIVNLTCDYVSALIELEVIDKFGAVTTKKISNFVIKDIEKGLKKKLRREAKKKYEKEMGNKVNRKYVMGGKYSEKYIKKYIKENLPNQMKAFQYINPEILEDELSNYLFKSASKTKFYKIVKKYLGYNITRFALKKGSEKISEKAIEKHPMKKIEEKLDSKIENFGGKLKEDFVESRIKKFLTKEIKVDIYQKNLVGVLLKNKNTSKFVFAIRNTKELKKVNESLNKKKIPSELFQLEYFLEKIKDKYKIKDKDIILTGMGNAAKLISIYKLKNECEVKGYFMEKPLNLAMCVDFTIIDINLSKNDIKIYENYFIEKVNEVQEKTIEALPVIFLTIITLFLVEIDIGIVIIYFLTKATEFISSWIKNSINKKKMKKILLSFKENNIIDNLLLENEIISGKIVGKILKNFTKIDFIGDTELYKFNIGKFNIEVKGIKNFLLLCYLYKIYQKFFCNIIQLDESEYILEFSEKDIIYHITKEEIKKYKKKSYIIDGEKYYYKEDFYIRYVEKNEYSLTREMLQNLTYPEVLKDNPFYAADSKKKLKEIMKNSGKDYYDTMDLEDEIKWAYNIFWLLYFFYKIQSNFERCMKEKEKIGYYLTRDDKWKENKVNILTYTLEKKIEENKLKDDELYFFAFVNERDGKLKYENKNIYINLSDEYIATIIRNILSYDLKEDRYNKKEIDLDKDLLEEDQGNIYGLKKENYKEIVLRRVKNLNYPIKKYPYLKEIKKNLKEEDLYKYIKIVKNDFGEEGILVGTSEKEKCDESAFNYCLIPKHPIRGRVVFIPFFKTYKNQEKEVKTTYVCDTAILKCPKLKEKEYLKLKVTSQDSWYIEDLLKATEEDFVGNINIIPEGGIICPQTKNKCVPETSKWKNISSCDTINGSFSLTSDSKCKCNIGRCYLTIVDSKSKDYLE